MGSSSTKIYAKRATKADLFSPACNRPQIFDFLRKSIEFWAKIKYEPAGQTKSEDEFDKFSFENLTKRFSETLVFEDPPSTTSLLLTTTLAVGKFRKTVLETVQASYDLSPAITADL